MTDSPERHDPDPGTGATPSGVRSVPYKGADLDAERGPGLGCFRFQVIVLAVLIVLTPIGVNAGWPDWLTATLLFVTLALLLVTGQTIIFLLRLVAADRRGRRRPLASGTLTVGELEDARRGPDMAPAADDGTAIVDDQLARPDGGAEARPDGGGEASAGGGDDDSAMRQ